MVDTSVAFQRAVSVEEIDVGLWEIEHQWSVRWWRLPLESNHVKCYPEEARKWETAKWDGQVEDTALSLLLLGERLGTWACTGLVHVHTLRDGGDRRQTSAERGVKQA